MKYNIECSVIPFEVTSMDNGEIQEGLIIDFEISILDEDSNKLEIENEQE